MTNVDEKIAKLKLEYKNQKEKELEKNLEENIEEVQPEKDANEILEEVIEQIKAGDLSLEGHSFTFRREKFLGGKIELPIPLGYFEEKVNTKLGVTLVNDFYGVSFNGTYIEKGGKKQSFEQFKKGMEKGFRDMELYLEWIEEGCLGEGSNKIYYGSYKTPTGKGDLYNFIFYREKKGSLIIGNYNCFYKDIKTWEFIIKASIRLMNVY